MALYGYIRTEPNPETGYTLSNQREAIASYAKVHHKRIKQFFIDESASLDVDDSTMENYEILHRRQGISDLIESLKEGDIVVVLNTSRLWRAGEATHVVIRRELLKHKAKLISIQQPGYILSEEEYKHDPGMINLWIGQRMLELADNYVFNKSGERIYAQLQEDET